MECDTCGKILGKHTPLHCPTCARLALYPLRIEHASVLIEKETLGKHVEAVARGAEDVTEQTISLKGSFGSTLLDRRESAKKLQLERTRSEASAAQDRAQTIHERAAKLRANLEELRRERANQRAVIAERKSDLASAAHGLDDRRSGELDRVHKGTKRQDFRLERLHGETILARRYLCLEAATLAGLKRQRRRLKDGGYKEVFYVGDARIYDLRDLNYAPPNTVTASLTNLAQLVVRVSHYLAIRLPAEITLPHKDYPLPTVLPPSSSYKHKDIPFPGSTPGHSSSNSPSHSRVLESRSQPRPRTLFIDKPLHQLAQDDAVAYATFVEGVSLLAWNIAWLCYAEGMQADMNHWEDVCSLGRNLWLLLVAQQRQPPQPPQSPSPPAVPSGASDPSSPNLVASPATLLLTFGQYSHGTSHSFLGAAAPAQALRSWRLAEYARVANHVKAALQTEMYGAEWEYLEEEEWANADREFREEPVVVGGGGGGSAGGGGGGGAAVGAARERLDDAGRGVLSARAAEGESQAGGSRESGRGASGWTKLKSRRGDAEGG